jgi:dTDP-4-amino-4,6-dideoxygalactose transaminase
MLASDDKGFIDQARKLSQQARENFSHYEHEEIGYNYRMSNILAAIGRGQLRVLDERVEAKRRIFAYYQEKLGSIPGIEFMPEAPYGRSNRWLTVILITPEEFGADKEEVRLALEAENIEARPVWKPMHMQPVFNPQITQNEKQDRSADYADLHRLKKFKIDPQITQINGRKKAQNKKRYEAIAIGGKVAEDLFKRGLCLPSGTAMTEEDLERIISVIKRCKK